MVFLLLVRYINGILNYILATQNIQVSDYIYNFGYLSKLQEALSLQENYLDRFLFKFGNRIPLRYLPEGIIINNLEKLPGEGGVYLRSAGVGGQLIKKFIEISIAVIKLSTKEFKLFPLDCFATIGIVSNVNFKFINLYKAGQLRRLNRRPIVRGVAKNAIDHPHGGGRGKTSGGRSHVTPYGLNTKGTKTRNPLKSKKLIFKERSKRRKKRYE